MESRKVGPSDEYRALLRGEISPKDYVAAIKRGNTRAEYRPGMLTPGRTKRRKDGWEVVAAVAVALICALVVTYLLVR